MTRQKFLNTVMLVIVVIAISLSGYFYYRLHSLEKNVKTDQQKAQEAEDLLGKVAKLFLIPTGEEPTIATVSDPDKLKDQAFFSEAQKDDKVLIFTKAGKAVLYRPRIDKIIEVAPIHNGTNDTPTTTSPEPTKDKTF